MIAATDRTIPTRQAIPPGRNGTENIFTTISAKKTSESTIAIADSIIYSIIQRILKIPFALIQAFS